MKNFFAILSTLILSVVSFACQDRNMKHDEVVLRPSDYVSGVTDSLFDYGPVFRHIMIDAHKLSEEGRAVRVELGSGTYHIFTDSLNRRDLYISNHDFVEKRPVSFYAGGISFLTVEGEGAKLLFHGRVIPFVVNDCNVVELKGFSIDYPRPALSQIEILAISGDSVRAKVLPETQFRIKENKFILEGEGYEQELTVTMPFSANRHMKWGRADGSLIPKKMSKNPDGTLTIIGWEEKPFLRVGDRYVLRSYYRPTPGIAVMNSQDVTIKDVTVHYAEGMGLVMQNTADITLDGFKVEVEKGSPRYFTTQADATHFSGCRGVIQSRDGLYEHMADDAINVHGTYLRVDSILDAKTVLATFAHEQSFGFTWFEDGDTIRFIDRKSLLPITSNLTATIDVISPEQMNITILTKGFSTLQLRNKQVAVENLSAHPEVIFEDNTVRNNRARGALFSTPRTVLVQNNLFDHTHGCAILLCGDANGWYESGPCYDITIRKNHFVNVLTSMYQFTNGIISIDPQIPELPPGEFYHGRVVIEDNIFETFPSPFLYAKSVSDLKMKNNTFIPNTDFPPIFKSTSPTMINVGNINYQYPQKKQRKQ